jgi:transposase
MEKVRIRGPKGRPRSRPDAVAADKAYDAGRIRRNARSRGIKAVIPEKCKPHGRKPGRPIEFDQEMYKRRNVVERTAGHLKHKRRIATRYEKTARNYMAQLNLAMIERILRLIEPQKPDIQDLAA